MRCIVGLSAASELARAGASVLVLEATAPGAGTSGTSYASVNANQKMPEPCFRLNLRGMEEHVRLAGRDADSWHPTVTSAVDRRADRYAWIDAPCCIYWTGECSFETGPDSRGASRSGAGATAG